MITDLKYKRQSAGFIRTNSSKALPTFKLPQKNDSSDDFSSFENAPSPHHPQQSDCEFSPYKNNISSIVQMQPTRPPLPPKNTIQKSASNERLKLRQRQLERQLQKQREQEERIRLARLQRERLAIQQQRKQNIKQNSNGKNREQEYLFSNQKLKRNYQTGGRLSDSPNCGKIIDRSQVKSRRQQQMRENLRKRIEVEKQLAQIGKVCDQIQHIQRQSFGRKSSGVKSVEKYSKQINRDKQILSQQKLKKDYPQQSHISNGISAKQKNEKEEEKGKLKKMSFGNKRYSFESQSDNVSQSSQFSAQQYKIQAKKGSKQESSRKQHESVQQKKLKQQQQQQGQHYQTTFKPNANQQILTSIQEYKKLHPELGKAKIKNMNEVNVNVKDQDEDQQLRVREQHEKARNRFISTKQKEHYISDEEEQIQEESEQQSLINQYPTQQFKKQGIHQGMAYKKNQNQKLKTIQYSSGVYKAKGGICFDLDVAQFTQPEPKPVQRNAVQSNYNTGVGRKGKKVNTKEEILKRRQMAKNYDKMARAKVFSGF